MRRPGSRSSSTVTALCGALLAFAVYMIGAGRAFGYDAAVTMENFVDGPPSWAFTRQRVWNNHPLFSFLEGLLADLAGTGEVVMRVLPALFAAIAIGALMWSVGRRWGFGPAISAGVVMATHPLVIDAGREARGYSMALLSIVVMGIAALELDRPWLFAAAGLLGLGAHMYAAIPFIAFLAALYSDGRLTKRWRTAALTVSIGAVLVYAGTLAASGRAGSDRLFRPTFPVDAAHELLGAQWITAILLGATLAVAARSVHLDRRWTAPGTVLIGGVIVPWVIAPYDLYPRFIYFLVPGLAVVAAYAVHCCPRWIVVVLTSCAIAVAPLVPEWTVDESSNRLLGERMGPGTCLASLWSSEAVEWYAPPRPRVCTSVAAMGRRGLDGDIAQLRSVWPTTCWRHAGAMVMARSPADCPTESP